MLRHSHLQPWYASPLLVVVCVFAALTWVGLLYQGPHSMEEAVSLASATSPISQSGGGITVKAWAGRTLIRPGDSFEFWILIKNTSSLPLTELRLVDFDSPGFVPIGNCWIAGVPGCRPGAPTSSQPAGLEAALSPGATGMAFAELKSSGSAPKPISAHVVWKLPGKSEQQQSIEIRPVGVIPQARHWVVVVYSLLKDFGLPLLLGILAYLFQKILQERARAQTAHSAILPTATTNAINYMLPAAGAARYMIRAIDEDQATPRDDPKWQEKQQERQQQAFFYFVFLLKRMRDLNLVGGGYFLSDLSSEKLVAECWRAFHRSAIHHFGYVDLSYVEDLLSGHETISLFLEQFNERSNSSQIAARRVAGKFPEWSGRGKDSADLRLLRVFAEILQTEANRLYLGWYEKVDSPDGAALQRWKEAIVAFQVAYPDILKDRNLPATLDDYVKNLPRSVRRSFRKHARVGQATPIQNSAESTDASKGQAPGDNAPSRSGPPTGSPP